MADLPTINLLEPLEKDPARARRRRGWRALIIVVFLALALGVAAFSGARAPSSSIQSLRDLGGPLAFLAHVGELVVSAEKPLAGSSDDRVNILLLGIGGAGHDGPLLTDTIMLASLKPSTHQVALISIPRDLLANLPGYGWRKINNAYAFAESEHPGTGGDVAAQTVSGLLDQPVPYYVRIDFRGFVELIDELGGIDVHVDRAFADDQYPTVDDEVQTISFSAGDQHMDGATALMFARSRHGSNGEGSDFARSRRQQKIILAAKDKLLSAGTLANPKRISAIFSLLASHISTNLQSWELLRFADIAATLDTEHLTHLVFDDSPNGLLTSAFIEGAYVLIPNNNDYGLLARAASGVFTAPVAGNETTGSAAAHETVRVEIQNGTKKEGLASQMSSQVTAAGFSVVHVGNADKQNYERTVIYDLTEGRYPDQLKQLREQLSADVSVSLPGWLSSSDVPSQISLEPPTPTATGVDFLIILGTANTPPPHASS